MSINYEKQVYEFLNEMWNTKVEDLDNLHDSIFAPKLIGYSPLGKKVGTDAMKDTNIHWSHAFPDMQLSNIHIISTGNLVTAEWRSQGTHQDDFNGRVATEKKVDYMGTTSFYFIGKKAVCYQCSINLLNIYEQLGFFLEKQAYSNQHLIRQNYNLLLKQLQHPVPSYSILSPREVECLSLFLQGLSAKTISSYLKCSFRTVQNHIGSIMDKLDCHSRYHLLGLFESLGLIPLLKDFALLTSRKY